MVASRIKAVMAKLGAARGVLADCEAARARLEDETDDVSWRLLWVAAIVLLRTVGHVLAKVDGAGDLAIRKAADTAFWQWKSDAPEHGIFRDFIDDERNLILKEYEHRMSSGPVRLVAILPGTAVQDRTSEIFLADGNLFRPMLSGPYQGEDGRDVLDQAIAWWKRELDLIEITAHVG